MVLVSCFLGPGGGLRNEAAGIGPPWCGALLDVLGTWSWTGRARYSRIDEAEAEAPLSLKFLRSSPVGMPLEKDLTEFPSRIVCSRIARRGSKGTTSY